MRRSRFAGIRIRSGNEWGKRIFSTVNETPGQGKLEEKTGMSTMLDTILTETPGICGGRIRIAGTRMTVHRVAVLYKQGQTAEEIAATYPQLALSQIYTALAYYHANHSQIEKELAADDAEYERLKQQIAQAEKTP